MAGINLVISDSSVNHKMVKHLCFDALSYTSIWQNSRFNLGFLGHDGYPYLSFDNDLYSAFVEGAIYNMAYGQVKQLLDLLFMELKKDDVDNEVISNLLFQLDGDFIIVFHSKSHERIYLLNDIYGRLPLYYYQNNGDFLISRTQDLIIKQANTSSIDRFGVAEFLVFGYMVSERTLVDGISYFLPGSLFKFNLVDRKFSISNIFIYNFESLISDNPLQYEKKLDESVSLFKEAVKRRLGKRSVVGLSGGLDSRVLAAAVNQVWPEAESVSRLSFNGREKKDVKLAEEVSKVLGMNFQIIESREPGDSVLHDLIALKSGLNSIENDYNLIYEKKLQAIFGSNFTYFTGDAGARIKPHIDIRHAKSLDHFVEQLIWINSRLDPALVSSLLGIDFDTFKHNIYSVIQLFPEQTFAYKDLHFKIYCRGFRYVLEGEDRKRNYFWTVMPYYSHSFFKSIMAFPDSYKNGYRMYFDFMKILNPKLNDIPNANWGLKPSDVLLPLYLKKGLLSKTTKEYIRRVFHLFSQRPLTSDEKLKIEQSLSENELYDEGVYRSLLESFRSDRSKQLFVRTPIYFHSYLRRSIEP